MRHPLLFTCLLFLAPLPGAAQEPAAVFGTTVVIPSGLRRDIYFLPRGVTGLLEDGWEAMREPLDWPRGITGPFRDAWAWLSRPISLPRGIAGAIEERWSKFMPRPTQRR